MADYKGLGGYIYKTQDKSFARGGEGEIFDVEGNPNIVAKIYMLDKRTTERERKLSFMVYHRPNVMEQYAWPLDVLYENGHFVGYIMPKIYGKEKLRNIYVFDNRQGKPWTLFIAIAKNLAAAVHNVHEIGQVIGDLNPENILVNPNDGMVTLVDTDSYHIADSNRIYRCGVGMPEYVAPELQGIHFPSAPLPTFTPETDRFALAVLIFALLMNGAHPFACKVISGSSSSFQPIDNMQKGKCAFFPDSRTGNMEIPRYAPDLDSLPKNIQDLFRRAFIMAYNNPSVRPVAAEWYNALEQLENNLKTCLNNPQHIYYYNAGECPWCKVELKMKNIIQIPVQPPTPPYTPSQPPVIVTPPTPPSPPSQPPVIVQPPAPPSPPSDKNPLKGWILLIAIVITILSVVGFGVIKPAIEKRHLERENNARMESIFVTAQTYLNGNNYEQAIFELNKITPEYSQKHTEVEQLKAKAVTEYRSVILQLAEESINKGQYDEALSILRNTEEILPNDSVISSNITNVSNIVLQNYMNQAQNYANNNQYAEALNILNNAENDCGPTSKISTLRNVYINSYLDQIFFQAEQMLQISGYDEAYAFISNVYNVLGNNPDYINRREAFTENKPIHITTLEYTRIGKYLDFGKYTPSSYAKDVNGNTYESTEIICPKDYSIDWALDIAESDEAGAIFYNLNFEYSRLTGVLYIPYVTEKYSKKYTSKDGSIVKILGDGQLLWEANKINKDTYDTIPLGGNAGYVNISGVRNLEIVVRGIYLEPSGIWYETEGPMVCVANIMLHK